MDLCKRYNKMVKRKEEKPDLDPNLILDNWEIGEGLVTTHPGDILWVWDDSSTGDVTYTTDTTTDATLNRIIVRPSHSGSFSMSWTEVTPTYY